MAHIEIKKGLDIPIQGAPSGEVRQLEADGRPIVPKQVALNLSPFEGVRFKLLAKVGDAVQLGQPLVEDKMTPGRVFLSPAGGIVSDIQRGLKRRLMNIVIDIAENEEAYRHKPIDVASSSGEQIVSHLLKGGMFGYLRQRPFNVLANPEKTPRAIFVKAIESAPFAVPAEMHVKGHSEAFQAGLDALAKIAPVHLVYREGSEFSSFENVEHHTAKGPHPIGNASVHIHFIDPIQSVEDAVWTATALDVVIIGYLLKEGKCHTDRIVSVGGPGLLPDKAGYFRSRAGVAVKDFIAGRIPKGEVRFISGDVLTGEQIDENEFLGFYDTAFCFVPENTKRELLHFFRLGIDKFTASGAYLSGHLKSKERRYNFTTNQHGEKRGFITSSPYDNVMPMNISTMHLVKAVLAEDFDSAEELGFLEVDAEDFALATFVDPSKQEMIQIMRDALREYALEVS